MIEVVLDQEELQRILNVHRDQVPYAVARTLTDLANNAQQNIRESLPSKFIIRNKYTQMGIRAQRANKKDWPRIKSEVGSVDEFMTVFEQGGIRQPPGKAFSIPKRIRNNIESLISRSKWPQKLLEGYSRENSGRKFGSKNGNNSASNERKPFMGKYKGQWAVWKRTGKFRNIGEYQVGKRKGQKRKRETIRLLWVLTHRPTHLKERPWLVKTTDECIKDNYLEFFKKNMEEAIGTKRPGSRN